MNPAGLNNSIDIPKIMDQSIAVPIIAGIL